MAKKSAPEGKKYSYMDTYGDLVTLLLCFFVLLFAMSTIEEEKFDAMMQAMTGQFGTPTAAASPSQFTPVPPVPSMSTPSAGEDPPAGDTMSPDQTMPRDFSQLAEAIDKYVEENNMQGSITVQEGDSGSAYIRLSNNLLFDGDSFVLKEEVKVFLDFLGRCFITVEDEIFQVNYIGHTAELQGSGMDDWVLCGERAGTVGSYVGKVVGFAEGKSQITGYGRMFPIGDNATVEGRAANRRVDIVVVGNDPATLAQALVEAAAVYFPDDDTQYFDGQPTELPGGALAQIPPGGAADVSLPALPAAGGGGGEE